MYHHSASRRGGRTGHRIAHGHPQPSSAAAKAAAAAKALHRRAQEELEQIQHQRLKDTKAYSRGIRSNPDARRHVFRQNSPVSESCPGICGEEDVSILKRLTASSNRLLRFRPSDQLAGGSKKMRENSDEQPSLPRGKMEGDRQATVPKHLHRASPRHASSLYPVPLVPYENPQLHPFIHDHGHSHHNPTLTSDGRKVSDTKFIRNSDAEVEPPYDERHYLKSHPLPCSGRFLDSKVVHGTHHRTPGYHPQNAHAQNSLSGNRNGYSDAFPVRSSTKSSKFILTKSSPLQAENNLNQIKEKVLNTTCLPQPSNSSRTMCHILGSHTPIHVPRAAMREIERNPLSLRQPPKKAGSDLGSVFRSPKEVLSSGNTENKFVNDESSILCESTAHKILLSLSKSFDCVEEGRPLSSGVSVKEERPKSPEEPPRIQHWHKHSSDSFEPQTSPSKMPNHKDTDGATIKSTSSFTLFTESFDMNLEGLLGPNASFGLGPMRSLSYGLGLGASADHGDNPSVSPMYSFATPKVTGNDCRSGEQLGGILKGPTSPTSESNLSNLQQSHSHPFPDSVDVDETNIHVGDGCSSRVENSSSGVVIGTRQAGYPPEEKTQHTSEARKPTSSNGNRCIMQHILPGSLVNEHSFVQRDVIPGSNQSTVPEIDLNNTKKLRPPCLQRIEQSLFGAMERHSAVFNTFTFLLPGAKALIMDDNSPNSRKNANVLQVNKREYEVARRRVNSALCAFGGVAVPALELKEWSSSKKLCRMQNYRDAIQKRYYEDENRLSWDIEEDPPIEVSDSESCVGLVHEKPSDEDVMSQCKLCEAGKLDQDSPFKASFQRNIGVMVYPAVNAFTATEPGIITPALTEMNNFIDSNIPPPESTSSQKRTVSIIGMNCYLPVVSPDSVRPGNHAAHSPSSLDDGKTPQRSVNYAGGTWISNHHSPRKASLGTKYESPSNDLLFLGVQELCPEQYRVVAPKKRKSASTHYLYPPLPLPYGQRKRISNAMFTMSKSIPGLTDECALVLGEARRNDAWDLAVAQLMTQVIVVTHCSAEDGRLDGLSKYLLTLGIAC